MSFWLDFEDMITASTHFISKHFESLCQVYNGDKAVQSLSSKSKFALFFLSYLLVFSATYAWFANNPFMMDDEIQIVGNSAIQTWDGWGQFWTSSTMDSGGTGKLGGVYYKPLMTTYYALIWNSFGENAAAFRLPLWFLHVGSAAMIALFASLYLPLALAYLWGLFFLLHPINSEVLFYLADAQDILYLFFGLLALLILQFSANSKRALVVCLFVLSASFFSKETGLLFLFIVPFYSYCFVKNKFRSICIGSVGLLAGYFYIRHSIGLTVLRNSWLHISEASFLERIQLLPWVLGHYVELLFFPQRLTLAHDVLLSQIPDFTYWFSVAIALLSILILIFNIFKQQLIKNKLVLFLLWVLLLWAGLHLHILVPLDGVYADRWFYLASWPLIGIVLISLNKSRTVIEFCRKHFIVLVSMVGIVVSLMVIRNIFRGQDWQDPLRFYQREHTLHPWDAVMSNNVGVQMFRQGQGLESLPYFQQATELNHTWDVGWNNLGAAYEKRNEFEQALNCYAKAISLGNYALAYENYIYLLYKMGRVQEVKDLLPKYLTKFPYNRRLLNLDTVIRSSAEK